MLKLQKMKLYMNSHKNSQCPVRLVTTDGDWVLTELKLLQSMDSFRRDLKTSLFHSVYGH